MDRRALILSLLLFFLLLFSSSVTVTGIDYLPDKMACIKLAGNFMGDVVDGEIDRAFDRVRPYFPISSQEFQNLVSRTGSQLQGSQRNFGKMLGYRFVREEKVKDFLVRFTFIIKHEYTVTRWKFLYYRPEEEKWLLNSLSWDDQVNNLF